MAGKADAAVAVAGGRLDLDDVGAHSPRMRPPIGAAMNAAISMTFMPSRSFRAMCFLLFQKDCSVTGGPVVSGARRLRGSGTKRVARSAFRAKRRVARLIYAFGIHMA